LGRDSSELRGRVLFLVGARRSGTNWLHNLLALHPRLVKVPSETHLLYTLSELEPRFQHGLVGSANTGAIFLPRDEMLDGFRDLCDRAFAHQMRVFGGPGKILVERTPLHAQHLALVGGVYPDAHVVHLIRDGREVAASLVRQPWGPDSLAAAAAEWVETVTKARSHRPPLYHEIRHEDLSADVTGEMRLLFQALGLDVSDELLERIRDAAPRPVNATPGSDPAKGSHWRQDLDDQQVAEIEHVAAEALADYGYQVGADAAESIEPRAVIATPSRRGALRRRLIPARQGTSTTPAHGVTPDLVQYVVDRLLAGLEAGDVGQVEAVLSPTVEIRLHDTGRTLRGRDGLAAAAVALVAAASPHGTQVRGDSHPGSPSFTVVWTHAEATGLVHRVLVITVDTVERVSRLDYYQAP
jgi:hypothetical protein